MALSPKTREAQFDEKWSSVAKKQEHCDPGDPADANLSDWWDRIAFDPEHRLVVHVEPGARVGESVEAVVEDFKRRAGGRPMEPIAGDEHRPYRGAILRAYGVEEATIPSGRTARAPRLMAPASLCYAAVRKVRRLGRAVEVIIRRSRSRPWPSVIASWASPQVSGEGIGRPARFATKHAVR